MAYTDNNTPVIERITLPSGNTYYIADREIRDVVDTLSQTVAGGVSYNIAWDGASEPVVGNIPEGITVTYNGQTYTGTMDADNATPGAFYLVKSGTQVDGNDVYNEYVPVGASGSKTWEKIGDTQISLSDIVTSVSLNKQTDTVIGTDATFKITQPTIALETGATAGDGVVSVVTGISSASASGDAVTALTGLGTASTDKVIGSSATFQVTQPTVTPTLYDETATGRVAVVSEATATNTNIKATASGGSTAWNSKDTVTALTGLGTPSTESAVKSVSPTAQKLEVTTVTGVSGSTTPNVVKTRSSQTTADGTWTAVASTDTNANSNLLANVSVTNGILTIGAATLDTQTTYSAGAPSSITIPTAADSATTVATGGTTSSGNGASVVTNVTVGDTFDAVTGYASPTTDSVIGNDATFTVTQPTVALATGATAGTGVVSVATGVTNTSKYLGVAASGANVAWNSKDEVTAVTGYASPTTDSVVGSSSTITVTPSTTNIKATASGANTAWNSKDSVTVLKSNTDVDVTKGSV